MSASPLVAVRGVSKIYQSGDSQIYALNNVVVEFAAGEVLGILGPSGSGKTTLLMIAGLVERPTLGEVQFLGETVVGPHTELSRLTDLRRRHIGFVFQRANLVPFLNAVENVQIAMQVDGVPAKEAYVRACSLLEELGVGHRFRQMPRQLSGGEQQRVSIARALANRPSIIFADEPTAALDSIRGRQVMALLQKLAREQGVAIAIVTHDARWLEYFDRAIEISDGQIAKQWTPEERSKGVVGETVLRH